MPGFAAPTAQPAQNPFPQQIQQLAAGLQDVGQASSRIGSAVQRQEDEQAKAIARQQDAINDSATGEKLIQYRVEAGQYARDFLKQEGVSARDGFASYMEGFEKINKKYDEYFQDPIQKQLWQNKSTLYREEWRYDMATHAQEQAKIVDKSNLVGSKDLSRQDYARSVGRQIQQPEAPGMLGKLSQVIQPAAHKAVVIDAVRRLNSDKDEAFIKSKIAEELDSLHKETINGMMGVVQPKLIMNYLEENKGEVSPEFYASAKADLQRTDKISNAKAEAIAIYSKLPSTEVNGIKIVDQNDVDAFISKNREERVKKILKNEAVDEQYYDTRDSYLNEIAARDKRTLTAAKGNIRNGWEQAFFEMSNSDYAAYDPDLNSGNALQKLEDKFPKLFSEAKNLGALGDIVEYARNTGFGAKSDPSVLEMAKDYVAQNGKTADKALFIQQFGNGLSMADKKRLLTDINIAQGKADQRTIEDGQSMRAIDRMLDEIGITISGKFDPENKFELSKDDYAAVEYQAKGEWDSIVVKGLPPGVNKAEAFETWLEGKKKELITNKGKTLEMVRKGRTEAAQPYYYTSMSERTFNLDNVDKKNVELAMTVLDNQNKKRFYFKFVDESGQERVSNGFGNEKDRDAAMRGYKAQFPQSSKHEAMERAYRPVVADDVEVRQLAVEIAQEGGMDPDVGNRINAIKAYQDRYTGLNETKKLTDLRLMRQSLIDGTFNPNVEVSKEKALMLTGLTESDFALYRIFPTGDSYNPTALQQTRFTSSGGGYKLSDLSRAFTPSFRIALEEASGMGNK